MATLFPGGIDPVTPVTPSPPGAETLATKPHSALHNDANEAIVALETYVGVTDGDPDDLTTRIADLETPRVTTIVSSATPTVNTDDTDLVTITALAANVTSFTTNLTGTPANGESLIVRIKDNGTPRTLAWGAKFLPMGVALPTTTVASKVLTVGFLYDTVTAAWGCVASAQEA